MEEQLRLRRIVLHTRHPHELADFFASILGAEMDFGDGGHFSARIGEMQFQVKPGTPGAGEEWEFQVDPCTLGDLQARWAFAAFRHGEAPKQCDALTVSCQDADGRRWSFRSSGELPSQGTRATL